MQHRQLAAILFTDIAGYTAIMAQDETRAKLLRDHFQKILKECHEKYGGEVVNDLGDGTLSLFSSIVQSVQCCIELQKTFQKEPMVPLRIGLHFGEVVRDERGVYGHAVNVASRLESLSQPGSILVSDRIRKELNNRPEMKFRTLGFFELKNVPKPLEVFAVTNQGVVIPDGHEMLGKGRILPSTISTVPAHLENFVGRDKELALLRDGWSKAQEGQGLIIGIAGEPGIGKTMLVEDFLVGLNNPSRPYAVARGRCSERLLGTDAYLPFLEILNELIQDEDKDSLLRKLAPAWYTQLKPYSAEESEVLRQAFHASQDRRKREMQAFLEALVRSESLILFIDDWHWADTSSVDLIAYLASRLPGRSILLLLTYRPADMKLLDHPFLPLQPELESKRLYREIALPFLQADEVDQYLNLKYPINDFPHNLAKQLQHRTEGSPLFMADLIEDLEDRGMIQFEDEIWRFNYTNLELENTIPESINSMIRRKINRLSAEDRHLISAAAVQGYEFDVLFLAKLFSRDVWEIEDQLRKLAGQSRLVNLMGEKQFPSGEFSEHFHFVHVLYRDVLFEQISLGRRVSWCGQMATILQETHQGREMEMASQLAPLYEWAQDQHSAIEQYKIAATHALSFKAFHEAQTLLKNGLKLISQAPQKSSYLLHELEIVQLLAETYIATNGYGYPDVLKYNQRALEICFQLGEPAKQIPILLGLMIPHFMQGDLETNRQIKEQILELSSRFEHSGYIGAAYFMYGGTAVSNGKLLEGRSNLDKTLQLFAEDPEKNERCKVGQ